jgi:uncharacterized protein (DUF2236 family)
MTERRGGEEPGIGHGIEATLPLSRSSWAWRVNAEPTVFAGGGRALLLQVAHPGVGAGVEQFSSYASDPWGRLFRTVDIMMKLSFGTPEVSARQQRILYAMHQRVKGTTDDGTQYSALDSDLQMWVWATLVDTALLIYERVRGRLSDAERAQFYEESKLVAYACGVPRGTCPDDWAAFSDYVEHVVVSDLRVTRSARAVATTAMTPPLPGPLAPATGLPNRLVTVGTLPPTLREQYGFTWDSGQQRRLDLWFTALRLGSRITPTPVRHLPTEWTISRTRPLRIGWLQRHGAAVTAAKLEAADLT